MAPGLVPGKSCQWLWFLLLSGICRSMCPRGPGMKYQNTGLCRGKPGGWSKRPSISLRWRTFSELSFYFQGSFTAWSLHPEGAQLGVPLTFNFWANLSPSAAPSTWAREGNFPTSHSPTPLKAWCTGSTSLGPCPKFQHSSGLEKPSGIAGLFVFFVRLFVFKVYLFSNL